MAPGTIRRALIAAAAIVLGVGLFIAIAVIEPAVCYGIDAECRDNRWRIAVEFVSAVVALGLLLFSIPDHGRAPDPDE